MDQYPDCISLSYGNQFDSCRKDILKAPEDWVLYLEKVGEIIIEGDEHNQMIMSAQCSTYKMLEIQVSTTLLVHDNDHILMEQSKYFKMIAYQQPYHLIYQKMCQKACTSEQIKYLRQFVQQYGCSIDQLAKQYKISKQECMHIGTFANFIVIEGKWINISISAQLTLMRDLLPFLIENNMIGVSLTWPQIANSGIIMNIDLFQLLASTFEFRNISSQQYQVCIQSIYNYLFHELSCVKSQYIMSQLLDIINSMLLMYLPADMQPMKSIQHLIGKYFIVVHRNNIPIAIRYDPMLIQCTLKARLQFMAKMKKKWTIYEIRGIFRKIMNAKQKGIDIEEVIHKNFRKYGEQYQIKIMPK